ncbi:MAG TPA: hypothetical protein VEJ87_16550 [Acidimicrobiales bacterium]|nr:hypothetical protein [Acidimicrobiales bacterium]
MAWFLIALGAVLVVFTFLLAFTIYGELALVVGVACLGAGIWMLTRQYPGSR